MLDLQRKAENLCLAFAKRHNLEIESFYIDNLGPAKRIRKQDKLDFDLTLYLVADDEFSIDFEGLNTKIFPFEKKLNWVNELLDGIVSGDCRLKNYYQFGTLKKSVLEQLNDNIWQPAYTAGHGFLIPLIKTHKYIIRNGYEVEALS